jgi:hypothetical protein
MNGRFRWDAADIRIVRMDIAKRASPAQPGSIEYGKTSRQDQRKDKVCSNIRAFRLSRHLDQ